MGHKKRSLLISILLVVLLSGLFLVMGVISHSDSSGQSAVSGLLNGSDSSTKGSASDSVQTTGGSKAVQSLAEEKRGEGRIFGKVIHGASQKPAAGAEVRLGVLDQVSRWQSSWNETVMKTSSDGAFEFTKLNAGHFRVVAEQNALLSYEKRGDVSMVQLEEDMQELGPLILTLHPSRKLRVTVVSHESGRPIKGALVRVLRNLQRDYETNASGETALFLSPDTWELEVSASGHELIFHVVDLSGEAETNIRIALKPAGEIMGLVTDENEKPISGVHVRARSGKNNVGGQTDGDGRFHFQHFSFDRQFSLIFLKEGYSVYSLKNEVLKVSEGKREYRVQMATGSAKNPEALLLAGRVADKMGAPVVGARIGTGRSGSSKFRETQTNDRGEFRVEGFFGQKWDYQLTVTASGFAPRLVDLPPDNIPDWLDIVLYSGHKVEGQVLDAWETPIEGVDVRAIAYERSIPIHEEAGKRTDVNGFFSFNSLPDRVRFSFEKSGYSPIDGVLIPVDGESVHQVIMQGPGVLSGHVVDGETGEPIKVFNLRVADSNRRYGRQSAHINPYWQQWGVDYHHTDGFFKIEGLAAGSEVNLVAASEGYGLEALETILVTDEPHATPLTIRMGKEGLSFGGRVVSPTGAALPGVSVSLLVYNAERSKFRFSWDQINRVSAYLLDMPSAVTDGSGYFRFEGQPDSMPIDLIIRDQSLALTRMSDLENKTEDQRGKLVVVVPEGGVIHGSVNRESLPDAQSITLFSEGSSSLWFNAQLELGDKSYQFPNLPPGNYEVFLEFQTEDSRNRPRMVQSGLVLAEGAELEINFGFEPSYEVSGVVYLNRAPMEGGVVFLRDQHRTSPTAPMARTDGSGHFSFLHVEPGTYEVVAFDGVPDGHEYHDILFRHPSRESIEVIDSDYFDEFFFDKFGNLRGRIEPPPENALQLILRGGDQQQMTHRSGMTAPDGSLFFHSLPPGHYELLYRGRNAATPAKSLRNGIIMPGDGADVDLGPLNLEERGSLRIVVDGAPPNFGSGVVIYLIPHGGSPLDRSQATVAGTLDIGEAGRLLKDMPVGLFHCRAFISDGSWLAQPGIALVEIFADNITEVRFSFKPLTMLSMTTPWDQRLASLSLEKGGEVVHFRQAGSIDLFSLENESMAVFQPFYALARGLPPGDWVLKASSVSGRAITRNIQLRTGRAQSIVLGFND